MVTAGDFRKGMTVEIDGQVWMVVDFLHVKPGKGAAFVRTKLKNVMTGNVPVSYTHLLKLSFTAISMGMGVFLLQTWF